MQCLIYCVRAFGKSEYFHFQLDTYLPEDAAFCQRNLGIGACLLLPANCVQCSLQLPHNESRVPNLILTHAISKEGRVHGAKRIHLESAFHPLWSDLEEIIFSIHLTRVLYKYNPDLSLHCECNSW